MAAVIAFPVNHLKEPLEKIIYDNTGFEVKIIGDIKYRLITPEEIEIEKVRILYNNHQVVTFDSLFIDISIYGLWNGVIRIDEIVLNKPQIELTEDFLEDVKSYQTPKKLKESKQQKSSPWLKEISIDSIRVNKISFNYEKIKLMAPYFRVRLITIKDFKQPLKKLSSSFEVGIESFIYDDYEVNDTKISGNLSKEILNIKSFEGLFYDERFQGSYKHHLITNPSNINELSLELEGFKLSNLPKNDFLKEYPTSGKVGLNTNLRYYSLENIKENVQGDIIINGEGIEIKNIDADKLINSYKDAQKITVLDTLGFYTLGPIGILASKGINAGKSIPGVYGGVSKIPRLILKLKVNNQSIFFEDVALRSSDNFIAAKGGVDLKSEQFKSLKIGFLNKEYCAELIQRVKGKISKPEFEVSKSLLKTMVAPLTNLVKSSKDFLVGCDPFYKGSLKY